MGQKHIKWDFTGDCNLRCKHCSVGNTYFDSKVSELSLEQKLEVVDKLAEGNIASISFLGGEPLVKGDAFYKVARHAARKNIYVTLVSNGTLMDAESIKKIFDAGIQTVVLSLEGSTAVPHESIRGKGTFSRVITNLKKLSKANASRKKPVCVKINTVVSQYNKTQISPLFDMLSDLGVDEWAVLSLGPIGYAGKNIEQLWLTPDEEIQTAVRLAQKWTAVKATPPFKLSPQFIYPLISDYIMDRYGLALPSPSICCTAAISMGFISPGGDLFPCDRISGPQYAGKKMGKAPIRPLSLLDHGFYEIWNDAYYVEMFPFILDPKTYRFYQPCNRCKYFFDRTCNPCPLYSMDSAVRIPTCEIAAAHLGDISGGNRMSRLGVTFVSDQDKSEVARADHQDNPFFQEKRITRRQGIRTFSDKHQTILFNPYTVEFIGLNEMGHYLWGLIGKTDSAETLHRETAMVLDQLVSHWVPLEKRKFISSREMGMNVDAFLSDLKEKGFILNS